MANPELLNALHIARTKALHDLRQIEAAIKTFTGNVSSPAKSGKRKISAATRKEMAKAKRKYWDDVKAGKIKRKGYKVAAAKAE